MSREWAEKVWCVRDDGTGEVHVQDDHCREIDCHRVVVIDPEDRAQVDALAAALTNVLIGTPGGGCMRPNTTQAALRSLVTPPKPPEPAGLGAVVEDDKGVLWTLCAPHDDSRWLGDNRRFVKWAPYADIAAVKVLSEGVTA